MGSVGSDAKLQYITSELRFDAGFNYKMEKPAEALKRLLEEKGLKGVDIYYDNVGGEQLDAALGVMNERGRIGSSPSPSPQFLLTNQNHSILRLCLPNLLVTQ